jgi:acetyl-CoA carboxylase alpha subunit
MKNVFLEDIPDSLFDNSKAVPTDSVSKYVQKINKAILDSLRSVPPKNLANQRYDKYINLGILFFQTGI